MTPAAPDAAISAALAALPVDAFIIFAVFCRVGALIMTAPGFSDFSLSPRIRLAVALAISLALAPIAAPAFPAGAGQSGLASMTGLIGAEILAGGFLGLTARAVMSALNVAGQIIALQMGLALAQIFDPSQEIQGALVSSFLAVLGATLIFASDLHHLMLLALRDSYALLAPGAPLAVGDMAKTLVEASGEAFSLGVRLSAPFILFGLVFYVGAGILSRLMPQAQVFFLLLPANLALGLMLLMMTIGLILTAFLSHFEQAIAAFVK